MKKVLIIMLLLIVSASMLLTKQIDREKIMPKKLIYSELPDDYPKELDELFEFYTEFLGEIYDITTVSYYRVRFEILSTKLRALPESQINKYAYLLWLARTSIPEYFCEYEAINSPYISIKTFNKRDSLSFISAEMYNKMDNHEELIPDVSIININIKMIVGENYPDISNITHYPNWIKCKVLESHYIIRYKENGEVNPRNYVIVEIIDDLSGNFHKKQIMLQLYMNRLDEESKILKEGNTYLIPFEYKCHNNNFVDLPESENIGIFSDIFYYSSAVNLCLNIAEDNTLEKMIKAPPGKKSLFTFDCENYDQAKETLQNSMNLLKSFSNIVE